MSFFSDMLKGMPINAVLREKNAQLETQNAALDQEVASLKDQLREAKAEKTKLEKRIQEFTHLELDETDIQILRYIANAEYSDPWAEVIGEDLGIHRQVAERRLNGLSEANYIIRILELGGGTVYQMADKGRDFLIERKLLG